MLKRLSVLMLVFALLMGCSEAVYDSATLANDTIYASEIETAADTSGESEYEPVDDTQVLSHPYELTEPNCINGDKYDIEIGEFFNLSELIQPDLYPQNAHLSVQFTGNLVHAWHTWGDHGQTFRFDPYSGELVSTHDVGIIPLDSIHFFSSSWDDDSDWEIIVYDRDLNPLFDHRFVRGTVPTECGQYLISGRGGLVPFGDDRAWHWTITTYDLDMNQISEQIIDRGVRPSLCGQYLVAVGRTFVASREQNNPYWWRSLAYIIDVSTMRGREVRLQPLFGIDDIGIQSGAFDGQVLYFVTDWWETQSQNHAGFYDILTGHAAIHHLGSEPENATRSIFYLENHRAWAWPPLVSGLYLDVDNRFGVLLDANEDATNPATEVNLGDAVEAKLTGGFLVKVIMENVELGNQLLRFEIFCAQSLELLQTIDVSDQDIQDGINLQISEDMHHILFRGRSPAGLFIHRIT